jgi:hypothetical protein
MFVALAVHRGGASCLPPLPGHTVFQGQVIQPTNKLSRSSICWWHAARAKSCLFLFSDRLPVSLRHNLVLNRGRNLLEALRNAYPCHVEATEERMGVGATRQM